MAIELKTEIFESGIPGPVFLVTARIHGTEFRGTEGARQVVADLRSPLNKLEIITGTLIVVPIVNQVAADRNVRTTSRFDLNRICERQKEGEELTNEQCVANALIDLYDDVLKRAGNTRRVFHLDLHTHGTAGAPPWAFIDRNDLDSQAFVRALPVGYACSGWNDIYAGHNQPSATSYLSERNAISSTVECGGHDDETAGRVAQDSILCGLTHAGMLNSRYLVKRDEDLGILNFDEIVPRSAGVKRVPNWSHLDEVRAGTFIWENLDGKRLIAQKEFIALFPTRTPLVEKADSEDFYMGHWLVKPLSVNAPPMIKISNFNKQ